MVARCYGDDLERVFASLDGMRDDAKNGKAENNVWLVVVGCDREGTTLYNLSN